MAIHDAQIQFTISKQTRIDFKDKVAQFIKATANQNPLELQFKINIPDSAKNITEKLDKVFARIKPFEISVTPSIPEANKKAIADKLALDIIDIAKNIPSNSIPLIAFGVNEKDTEANIRQSLSAIMQRVKPTLSFTVNPSQNNSQTTPPITAQGKGLTNLLPGLADKNKDYVANYLLNAQKQIEDSTKNTSKIEIDERKVKDEKGKITKIYDAVITEVDKQNGKLSKHIFQINENDIGGLDVAEISKKVVFDQNKMATIPFEKARAEIDVEKARFEAGMHSNVTSMTDYYDQLEKLAKQYYAVGTKEYRKYEMEVFKGRKRIPFDVTTAQDAARSQILEQEKKSTESNIDFSKIKQLASQITDVNSLKVFNNELKQIQREVKIYRGELVSTLDPNQKFIKDMREFPIVAETMEQRLNQLGTKVDVRPLREKLLEAKKLREELTDKSLKLPPEVRTTKKVEFDSIMSDIRLNATRLEQVIKTTGSLDGETNQMKAILEQLERHYIKYKAAIDQVPGLTQKFEGIAERLKTGAYADVKTARSEFFDVKQEARAAGVEIETFSQKIRRLFGNNLASAYAAFGIHAIMNNMMKLYQNVVKIDTALTELRKVSNATWGQMSNYLDKAIDRSVKLGIEISNLINASAGFARLGYNLEQSAKLGEVASVLFNVGDQFQSVDEATESIVSAMHAFNIESERAMTIADKLNGVSNKFSISAAGIATAMKKSASALSVAGNSIDQTMGLIVGGNVVVQDPDVVGNVLKTMSLRLRSAKVDLEEAGLEAEGMASSVSSLAQKIEQLTNLDSNGGFSILTDSGNLKSTYDMLKGISEAYSKMDGSSTNAAALLELISGKRNANAAASILTNFKSVEAAMKTSMNSQGSAMAEHERWLESIEAKTARLNAQLQELATVLINSKAAKGTIDVIWGLTRALTKLLSLSGSFPLLLTGLAGLASKKLNFGNSSENLPYHTLMSAVA